MIVERHFTPPKTRWEFRLPLELSGAPIRSIIVVINDRIFTDFSLVRMSNDDFVIEFKQAYWGKVVVEIER